MTPHLRTGVLLGLVLAFAIIFGGWWGLVLALLLGGLGGLIGAHFDGLIDIRQIWDAVGRGRRG
ncbi:hypothetical protein CKALI_10210 [Corynebacterium kalinowskii]|uniref:DUF2273 domain-containing protein n=1 Tax=Corynebacterium kalinowskii TaxID=2675216 RepID=A0A6B8VTG9_9CORY|nr:hypothetical protein [Corynebacterium kalinowskii]QGU02897.1 hypothetical protein CKALI_10210 [Corynebacterium kalinowskii]